MPPPGPSSTELLARDRKKIALQPELEVASPFGGGPESASTSQRFSRPENDGGKAVLKSRRQRQRDAAEAAGISSEPTAAAGPKKCKEAIDKGLELYGQRQYQEAIAMFNLALELPGNGAYRLPTSPREYSCPSDAEENAALYNMACAYVQLGQRAAAITCLEAVLENGFEDFSTMRTDPDLKPLGKDLQDLLGRFEGAVAQVTKGVTGIFGGGRKKELVSDTNKKPFLLW